MAETREITIKILGEESDFTRAVQNAVASTKKLDSAVKSTGKAKGKLGDDAKKAKEEISRLTQGIDGAKRALQGVGGRAGETGEKLTAFAEGLSGLSGALGGTVVAAGGVVTAFAAVGVAGLAAAANASELLAELDALHRAPVISESQRDDLKDADMAMLELKSSVKEVAVVLGANFAPALRVVASGLNEVVDSVRYLVDNATTIARVGSAIGSLGASEALLFAADYMGVFGEETVKTKEDIEELTRTYDNMIEVTSGGQIAMPEAKRFDVAAFQKQQQAIASLDGITRRLTTQRLEGEAALYAAHEDTLAQIDKQAEAAGSSMAAWQAADAARLAAAKELEAGLVDIAEQRAAREKKEREEREAAAATEHQKTLDRIAEEEKARIRAAEEKRAAEEALLDEIEAFIATEQQQRMAAQDGILDNTRMVNAAIIALAEQGNEKQKQIGRIAFRADQVAAGAKNVIYGLNAATAALDDAPVPLNFILAGSVAAAAAANTAAIFAQPMPYHTGRVPDGDEIDARLTRREAVVTPQGQQRLGDLISDANADRGHAPPPLMLVMGHRVIDRGSAQALRSPKSALRNALNREPVGHAARRRA